jgi:hypothetical protein
LHAVEFVEHRGYLAVAKAVLLAEYGMGLVEERIVIMAPSVTFDPFSQSPYRTLTLVRALRHRDVHHSSLVRAVSAG